MEERMEEKKKQKKKGSMWGFVIPRESIHAAQTGWDAVGHLQLVLA